MSTTGSSRWSIGRVVLVALALLAAVLTLPTAPAQATPESTEAGDPPQYYDGLIRYSQVLNCPSVIQGFPYYENGAGVYSGVYTDPDDGFPAIGQQTFFHIVVYGLGNACSGQRFVPGFELPAGVQLDGAPYCANSLAPTPTLCGNTVTLQQNGSYGGTHILLSGDTANARTWGLPPGRYWEFVFPIKSTTIQTSTQFRAQVKMLDGNSSPVLRPSSNLYVFGPSAPPAVIYDSPSTVASDVMPEGGVQPTAYGLFSDVNIITNGVGGTVDLLFGTNPNGLTTRGQVVLAPGFVSHRVWTDWQEIGFPALQPGQTYHWRARFTQTGGNPVVLGALQSFTVPTSDTCRGQEVTVSLALGQQATEGDDVILGTAAAETIRGLGGNDVICAGGGNDGVEGGTGNDTLDGGPGRDNLLGGADTDTLVGGTGADTASYAGTATRVVVSLGTTAPQNTQGAGTDSISGVENLTGSSKNDRLTGNAAANAFDGGAGSDVCNGGPGQDTQQRCETRTSIP